MRQRPRRRSISGKIASRLRVAATIPEAPLRVQPVTARRCPSCIISVRRAHFLSADGRSSPRNVATSREAASPSRALRHLRAVCINSASRCAISTPGAPKLFALQQRNGALHHTCCKTAGSSGFDASLRKDATSRLEDATSQVATSRRNLPCNAVASGCFISPWIATDFA